MATGDKRGGGENADQLEPMVANAAEALREAGIEEPIGTVLADGGYWNSPAISEVRRQGTDVLVPTQDRRRTAPRKLSPRRGEEARRIEAVLSTPEGGRSIVAGSRSSN
jgi:predicted acylesterase/phospholipase RssA